MLLTNRPAERYTRTTDLGVITTYFNPAGFQSKRRNYTLFREPLLAAGIPLITVECAFDDRPFELTPEAGLIQIRGRDVMWQKERLLNIALANLPVSCRKFAWLDADILFENPDWALTTAARLEQFPIVQPFDTAIRLPREGNDITPNDIYKGFAAVYAKHPQRLLNGDFAAHGHTGFAWAARRDVFGDRGLYDACIAGSGDHMMAHAFCGDWTSCCVDRIIGVANRHRASFIDWCRAIYPRVRARVGFVPGAVLHLWHGDVANRRYVDRNRELAGFGFDPAQDIRIDASGCWEWASSKPNLHRWAADYFGQRLEDGHHT